jgi:hypothetical protein
MPSEPIMSNMSAPCRKRYGRGFDVLWTAIASLLLFDLVMWYFGVARGQCRGLGQLRPLFHGIEASFEFDLLGIPYIVLTGVTLVAARKGALSGRFCGSLALILGAVMLLQPPATIQGDINEWRCYAVDYSLPWRIGLGALWTGLGLALFFNRRWTMPVWMTRTAGVLLLLMIHFDSLQMTDAYSHPLPSYLVTWELWAIDTVDRRLDLMQIAAPVISIWPASLALTLVGVRQGTIGLPALRAALLAFGAAHVAVILVNAARLVSENAFIAYYAERSTHLGLPIAVIWAALWLGLGIAFCLIRREWWERVEAGAA